MITNYEATYNAIVREISAGKLIQVTTQTHSKLYKTVAQFKYNSTGVYVQRGKKWDCINFCKLNVVSNY
jgi:hypothetical protein